MSDARVSESPASTGSIETVDHSARNNRVIWLLLAAAFVVILNETIMGVAIPHLKVDLGIDSIAAQWLTTAFMLTMAVVIPITGFMLQRFSTRSMFIAAMSLFSLGTLVAALAPGFEVLLGARVIQASGTAIMMPLLMTTIMTLVPPANRGRLMGRVSIVMSVAPAIGPTISGLILNYLTWRWMFWIVLPIALVMLVIGYRRVENVTEPRRVPIDVFSVILSAFGFGGLVYGLSQIGGGHGGDAAAASANTTTMIVALSVGVVGLAAFIIRQLLLQRRDRALLDLRTFRSGNFSVAMGVMTIVTIALFGTLIVLPIYMQEVIQLDPLQTGLLLLPGSLLMGLMGPIVGRLFDRHGPRVLLVPGSIIVSSALWFLTTVTETTSPFVILAAHVTLSLGLSLMFTPLFTSALGSVEPRFYSHGSAIVSTIQQVAGAAGTALFITIMASQTIVFATAGAGADAAAAGGVRAAFTIGAVLSLLTIVGAFFVKKPADMVAPVGAGH
ncbi:DHA2 family efflux MFS transporter permease subunit [Agromyces atrinae]|uniref:DHA2 family efflux MFS transporter permease subunit n=1 Tax=Agromyces atrinae TaxID=592376 RepID=A0A4Q2M1Y9_9MICO|nr:DHA2 family efflux MFS transporter permease subunit [Agromyces atrinae]NYD65513.1 DHA2 family lincomycin resistance protein-like MFS transporter [Agromyces atrinae]RXZ85758.1 DHA2 family efflux MFS transporter permease subunit [Agromyces atrinae]